MLTRNEEHSSSWQGPRVNLANSRECIYLNQNVQRSSDQACPNCRAPYGFIMNGRKKDNTIAAYGDHQQVKYYFPLILSINWISRFTTRHFWVVDRNWNDCQYFLSANTLVHSSIGASESSIWQARNDKAHLQNAFGIGIENRIRKDHVSCLLVFPSFWNF